jgi:hypothetical protein
MVIGAQQDMADIHATHGEMSTVHSEVAVLREQVMKQEARLKALEPESE